MKRRAFVVLTVVLTMLITAVSSTPGYSQPPLPVGIERLRQDAGGSIDLTLNPLTNRPSFIRGRIPLSAVGLKSEGKADPETVALAVVDRYADIFGIKQATSELNVVQTIVDDLGMTHVTLGQVYQGVEVYNAQMKVHLSADGHEVVTIGNGFVPDIQLPDTQPRIGADLALELAQKTLPGGVLVSGPRLVVYPGTDEAPGISAKLAWLVELRDDALPARNLYVLDAAAGTILDVLDRLYTEAVGAANMKVAAERAMQQPPDYNTAFLTDAQLEDYASMTSEQIRFFLVRYNSYFRQPIQDVDGVTFDPSSVLVQAASQYQINPRVLLATLEKECNGVTRSTRPSDRTMRSLVGCGLPSTARQQLSCAAERFRAYHNQLTSTGSTVSGWQVGVPKLTQDGVWVTPATKATAGQFTYTPYAGAQWGGNQPSVGAVYLFYYAWNQFGFNGCLPGQYRAEYYNNRTLSGDPTFTRCDNAPTAHEWDTSGPGHGIGNDNFSARWTSRFTFAQDTYTFLARSDDGMRVWVDGSLILDAWYDHTPTNRSVRRDMTAGEYEVKVEYYEHKGGATAHVHWWGDNTDADDDRLIATDETLWGVIKPNNDTDTYYFEATQGQKATIRMTKRLADELDPYLTLYGPDGSTVTRDDDSGDGNNALIKRVVLPQTGHYHIAATSYHGSSGGLYELSLSIPQPGCHRETYNANHTTTLPGTLARFEAQGPVGDQDVDNAHDFAGETYDYFKNTYNRDSYDNEGATIISTAHYGLDYNNAFWNGKQMVYGDGFPVNDVVAHELTHAVTEHSANLEYKWQSGALNESFSDIFGAMVDRDDWLMGEDLPPDVLGGREAIRDLSNPPRFGQPDHTRDWVSTCSDNEGVHTNSGIVNKAYYNIAIAIGKDKAERIFYRTLAIYLQPTSSLEVARAKALQSAQDLYGANSAEYNAVRDGFNAVGLDGQWNPPSNDCSCAATTALKDETAYPDRMSALRVASTLYRVRDQLLSPSAAGQHYRGLYERYTARISYLLLINSELRTTGGQLLQKFTPSLNRLMDGLGSQAVVTADMTTEVIAFLQHLAEADRARGGGDLARTIELEMARIDLSRLAGMTFDQAWMYLNLPSLYRPVYLPAILK